MNCPHCQTELPPNYGTAWCPRCGKDLPAPPPHADQPKPSSPVLPPVKINWLVFFAVLLAPAFLSALTAACIQQQNESVSPAISFFGGCVAGIACGVMLALRLGKTSGARVGIGILFSLVMAGVCIVISFFGCQLGGYQMRFG